MESVVACVDVSAGPPVWAYKNCQPAAAETILRIARRFKVGVTSDGILKSPLKIPAVRQTTAELSCFFLDLYLMGW